MTKNNLIDISSELADSITVHKRINQEIIVTTRDKLTLELLSAKQSIIAKHDWKTPLGLSVAFITTICTAEFKNTLLFEKAAWHAIFVLLLIGSLVWCLYAFYRLYANRNKDDIDKIIERIMAKDTPVTPGRPITVKEEEIQVEEEESLYKPKPGIGARFPRETP